MEIKKSETPMTTDSKLHFRSTERAMLYIENYLAGAPLKKNGGYYGEVITAENGDYLIEIIVSEKKWFSRTTKRILVGGISSSRFLLPESPHSEPSNIVKGDLIFWCCIDLSMALPCGVIIKKLDLALDFETNKFDNQEERRQTHTNNGHTRC